MLVNSKRALIKREEQILKLCFLLLFSGMVSKPKSKMEKTREGWTPRTPIRTLRTSPRCSPGPSSRSRGSSLLRRPLCFSRKLHGSGGSCFSSQKTVWRSGQPSHGFTGTRKNGRATPRYGRSRPNVCPSGSPSLFCRRLSSPPTPQRSSSGFPGTGSPPCPGCQPGRRRAHRSQPDVPSDVAAPSQRQQQRYRSPLFPKCTCQPQRLQTSALSLFTFNLADLHSFISTSEPFFVAGLFSSAQNAAAQPAFVGRGSGSLDAQFCSGLSGWSVTSSVTATFPFGSRGCNGGRGSWKTVGRKSGGRRKFKRSQIESARTRTETWND